MLRAPKRRRSSAISLSESNQSQKDDEGSTKCSEETFDISSSELAKRKRVPVQRLISQPLDTAKKTTPRAKQKPKLPTIDNPSFVDHPEVFNTRFVEISEDYKKLTRLRKKSGNTKYVLRAKGDPDLAVPDNALDKEVPERSTEGHEKWDEQWRASGKTGGFEIDYILATTKRKVGEGLSESVLIKYCDYPVPSWESKTVFRRKGTEPADFLRRLLDLDFIEIRLRAEIGDAEFEKLYPHRYLEYEIGEGNGGYVKDERARYVNFLRAVESRILYICSRFGIARVYVEDWINGKLDGADQLKLFEFVTHLINSGFVEQMVQEHAQLENLKCGANESKCKRRHKNPRCHGAEKPPACPTHEKAMFYECTDDCACKKEECHNRVVQTGRQITLCIFRDPVKNWSVRTCQEIPRATFVTEYLGEVNKEGTQGDGIIYDFPMMCPLRDENGVELCSPFVVAAHKKGNESRFINHSCNPNLDTKLILNERSGCFYHHIAFYSNRMIIAGEELTFNYFPEVKDDFLPFGMFDVCGCGSNICEFTAEKLRARREKAEEAEEEEGEEFESDADSDETIVATPRRNPNDRVSHSASPARTLATTRRSDMQSRDESTPMKRGRNSI